MCTCLCTLPPARRECMVRVREGEEYWYCTLNISSHEHNHKHNSEQKQSLEEHRCTKECTEHVYCCGHEEAFVSNGRVCG